MEIESVQSSLSLNKAWDEKPKEDWRSQVPSVSQFTRSIRGHIENAFFDVWVRGEISNFRKPVSGHAYFVLKDLQAQLRVVLFRQNLSRLKFQLRDGMEVLVHGAVTVYEARGEYQIVSDTLEPVGVGALQLAFEQLKKKLQGEGLFDSKYKKPIPLLPKRIGIITSSTGAAVRDILKVLSHRYSNLPVMIIASSVQGERAAGEICTAISLSEKWNMLYPDKAMDVLIVGRGGGSQEDLWPFNEENVARAIFQCSIPVISAVGHEIDFTIADFVADLRAPTPSAAAEMVVANKAELKQRINQYQTRLWSGFSRKLEQLRLHLGHLTSRIQDPREKIRKYRQAFGALDHRLKMAIQNRIALYCEKFQAMLARLNSLSPLKVLSRGYSLTLEEGGKLLRSVKHVKKGMILKSQLEDGLISSEVLSIESTPL